nr:dimethylaniline monooxygenase [N-oxide-forming] 5-like isoform X1 [Ciona intestinalis]XP_026693550.1 dimethylaniline monooxygenase [N-oxide-forming] 5-like isoform X2 [Ciona intestinalis]|eukprot:XP_018670429.1 dimethylaniline monooxygenase [N-oxide-forming] 5-like isoform X1 [Ciona intestinalis]
MASGKRIAIIGCGASGLAAIKVCLEDGLEPICFEKNHDIGGLWRFEESKKNGATVYRSTHVNTSKEMMSYSDFPLPKEYANYMHNSYVLKYYRMYAERFGILKHIQFHTEVLSCDFADDYSKTGNWELKVKNSKTEKERTEIFNGVMVAVGHHAVPNFPVSEFAGYEKFKGPITHSTDYRDFKGFEDKNVVVVGMGNSGADIAVELSWHCPKVCLSTRKGSWIFGRVGGKGYPLDYKFMTRYNLLRMSILPESYTRAELEASLNGVLDHANWGIKPKNGPLNQHPLITSALPDRILNGSVTMKPNVQRFKEDSVVFVDGSEVKADAVVFATGYVFSFPFLKDSLINFRNKTSTDVYQMMWPLSVKHNTLCMIGHVQALATVNPLAEMQSRWATRVFKGLSKLPSEREMRNQVEEKHKQMKSHYYESQRHTIEVDHIPYMDFLAKEIGCKPNLWRIALTDLPLAKKMFFEYCTGYQYRLVGPGKWSGAREAIMTQTERMLHPLKCLPMHEEKKTGWWSYFIVVVIATVIYFVFNNYY